MRIHTSIETFFKDLELYFKRKKWPVDKPKHMQCEQNKPGGPSCNYHWKSSDLEIKVSEFHPDKSIKSIQYTLYMPGIKELKDEKPVYSFTHSFKIELPREYPARVDKIKLFATTQIFHPRFHTDGWGEGCIQINGEIDRILMDLIFQVLCDPDRIRPPKLYTDSDFGTNSSAMKWFQNGDPFEVFSGLMHYWEEYRNKRHGTKTKIIDLPSSDVPRGVRILPDS